MTKGVLNSTNSVRKVKGSVLPILQKQKFNRLIADDIRTRILTGVYTVGALLPTEPELAADYGSNRNTLREAIRILETQGFVSVRQGQGVRVVDFRSQPTIEVVAYLLAQAKPSPETATMVADLLGLRKILADEIARQAAGNITPETAREIRKLLRGFRKSAISEAERTHTDQQILEHLVRATGSLVYTALFHSLYRVVAAGASKSTALTTVPADYADRMESILKCLLAGDGEGARKCMRALCDASDAVLLQAFLKSIGEPT